VQLVVLKGQKVNIMKGFKKISALLLLTGAVALSGCTLQSAATPDQQKVKVHCPACGTDLDALFYKQYK